MVNAFGRFCRKLRVDNDELLAHMAKRLGVTSAFLSKVEHGDKKPPREWRNKIIEAYRLNGDKIAELDDCLFEAINSDGKLDDRDDAVLYRSDRDAVADAIVNAVLNHNKAC